MSEFFTANKKFKSVAVDPKGTHIVFETEEAARPTLSEVQLGLDKANDMSKEAGTDVTFVLNRKDIKFFAKDNKVLLPLNAMEDSAPVKNAFPVANLRDIKGTLVLEVVLEAGASLTLADVTAALEKIPGASLMPVALHFRPDGTVGME